MKCHGARQKSFCLLALVSDRSYLWCLPSDGVLVSPTRHDTEVIQYDCCV